MKNSILRIVHRGATEGSLYLSDLGGETNTRSRDKLPVYLREEEHLDLPLDSRVQNSFERGTIRGFIDQGSILAGVISSDSRDDDHYESISYGSNGLPDVVVVWQTENQEKKIEESLMTYNDEGYIQSETKIHYDVLGNLPIRQILCTFVYDNEGNILSSHCEEIHV